MHYAVLVGNTAIAAKLLQHRADIEATDKVSINRRIYPIFAIHVSLATSIAFLVGMYCILYIRPRHHGNNSKAKSGRLGNGVSKERAQLCLPAPIPPQKEALAVLRGSGCQAQSPPSTEVLGGGK